MRKLFLFGLIITSCGIQSAVDQAEATIDEINVSACMDYCGGAAEDCLSEANHSCIDDCEISYDECLDDQRTCLDNTQQSCLSYEGTQFYNCMSEAEKYCDKSCPHEESDCNQICGEEAQDCVVDQDPQPGEEPAYAECVKNCIKDIEDRLKSIDL